MALLMPGPWVRVPHGSHMQGRALQGSRSLPLLTSEGRSGSKIGMALKSGMEGSNTVNVLTQMRIVLTRCVLEDVEVVCQTRVR